jgi:hypothetical protein
MANLTYGEQRAVNELSSILSSQWKNGMLPSIRFIPGEVGYSPDAQEWGVTREISGASLDTSGITQPPNPALVLWQLYNGSDNKRELVPFLEEAYESLKKYHEFLLTERDPNGEGLAATFHPWSNGTDNTPCYDNLVEITRRELAAKGYEQRIKKRKDIDKIIADYRPGDKDYECYGRLIGFFVAHDFDQKAIYEKSPFVVQDVMFNSILAESISSLAKVAEVLAEHYQASNPEKSDMYKKEALKNSELASRVQNAIRVKLYDSKSGMFYNFDVRNGRLLRTPTIHSLSPLFGKVADGNQADRLIEHLQNPNMFNPSNGIAVPTVPINSPKFENVRYWRGPVWPVTNWLINRGIEHYDSNLAQRLKEQTIEMIAQGYDLKGLENLASSLMEYSSFGEAFTTASRTQYKHAWLWDSGFAALGWRHVKEKHDPEIWEKVEKRKEQLLQDIDLKDIRSMLNSKFHPLFDEHYAPITTENHKAGFPSGAEMMTWSAALFLDLVNS